MSRKSLEQFSQIRRALNLLAVNALKTLEIGPKQMVMLLELEKNGQLSLGALAKRTNTDPAAVSRALSGLERIGWVTRWRDKQDKRQWLVKLSSGGKKRVPQLQSIVESLGKELVRDLSPADREKFGLFLERIATGLKHRVNSDEMIA